MIVALIENELIVNRIICCSLQQVVAWTARHRRIIIVGIRHQNDVVAGRACIEFRQNVLAVQNCAIGENELFNKVRRREDQCIFDGDLIATQTNSYNNILAIGIAEPEIVCSDTGPKNNTVNDG